MICPKLYVFSRFDREVLVHLSFIWWTFKKTTYNLIADLGAHSLLFKIDFVLFKSRSVKMTSVFVVVYLVIDHCPLMSPF